MKKIKSFGRKTFHLSNILALFIIISAALVLAWRLSQPDDAGLLGDLAHPYIAFALVVLIIKLKEWLGQLNAWLQKKNPAYARFWQSRAASMEAKDRATKIAYFILRALTIVCAVAMLLRGKYDYFLLCIVTLVLFTVPDIIQRRFSVRLPSTLEIIIYGFIFAAEILGEINNFYGRIHGWDTMLHTMNGFLCAAIGFAMVDMLNRNSTNINLSPLYLALTAFCFSMTIGVLWEFIEFFSDLTLNVDMQKDRIIPVIKSILINPTGENVPVILRDIQQTIIHHGSGESFVVEGGFLDIGIRDTMKDLFVNFIGAVVFSTFGYFYVKGRDRDQESFAARFIPVVEKKAASNGAGSGKA